MSPRKGDAGIAALAALACGVILTGRTGATVGPTGPVDWIMVGAQAIPLIWRRRSPLVVFAAVTVLLWVSQAVGAQSPAALLYQLIALHALARYRSYRVALPAVAVTAVPVLGGPVNWTAVAVVGALVVATVVLGDSQRTRAAYLAGLEDRARRLEVERDQRARLAVAEERARIAREMHDVVAHHIAVMIALSDGAAAISAGRPAEVMGRASATGRQALAEMRGMVGLLTPDRAPQPGLTDIDELVERVRAAGVRVRLTRDGTPGDWGAGAGLAVYRILQEALTNTLKHAGPTASAEVVVRYHPAGAEITVLDDGAGRASADEGHGLAGMRERALPYDGRVESGPRPGAGWRVHASLRFPAVTG
ncbi:signal transduction histidine kinase [Actinoplanes octamycinicus]|uniref:histidine kinase n=1 Tax=Actinoplanes octamycinicus TaxID=135948 RepID=A0A7W7M6Y2_9ACTN|nr:histidine kinase [Actinoplanes octamycinicus]MBB4739230.1 signal transduction histidine kinase [Actinoplanes octamycinicus]GIE58794.1 two-component sensor histidine kinase [Actinoplanes octamycinicus]